MHEAVNLPPSAILGLPELVIADGKEGLKKKNLATISGTPSLIKAPMSSCRAVAWLSDQV